MPKKQTDADKRNAKLEAALTRALARIEELERERAEDRLSPIDRARLDMY